MKVIQRETTSFENLRCFRVFWKRVLLLHFGTAQKERNEKKKNLFTILQVAHPKWLIFHGCVNKSAVK